MPSLIQWYYWPLIQSMKRWSETVTFQNHQHCYSFCLFIYFAVNLHRSIPFKQKKNSLLQIHEFYFQISSVTKNTLSSCCTTTNIPILFLCNCFIKVALTLNVRCLTPTAAQKIRTLCLSHAYAASSVGCGSSWFRMLFNCWCCFYACVD